jgi:hypothetical protein
MAAVKRHYSLYSEGSILATLFVQRKIGTFISFPGAGLSYDYTSMVNVMAKAEDKSPTVKRPRPKGIEVLFNGTTVSSNKVAQNIGTYVEVTSTPSVFAIGWQLVPCPQIGFDPYGSTIPDKYWSTELRNKVRDTDINLAQAFAERKQVENMFVDYGKRLIKASTALRKRNVNGVFNALLGTGNRPNKGWKKTIKDSTGVASDHWLAFQYGIRPLISDLEGAVTEYYKVRQVSPLIRSYSLRANNPQRGGGTVSQFYPAAMYTTNLTQNANIRCTAEFQDSASAWDQTAARVGLTDPLLLAWELIPYSFVVDWFINVGDFLQAAGTIIGLKRVGISITTSTTEESFGFYEGGNSNRKRTLKYREFRNVIPAPELRIKAHPLSLSHVTSALALIRQVKF